MLTRSGYITGTVIRETWIAFIAGRFKTSFGRRYPDSVLRGWRIPIRIAFIVATIVGIIWIWHLLGPDTNIVWRLVASIYGSTFGSFGLFAVIAFLITIVASVLTAMTVFIGGSMVTVLRNSRLYGTILFLSVLFLATGLVLQVIN